jgi:hypothetical protein
VVVEISILEQEQEYDPMQVFTYAFKSIRIALTVSKEIKTIFRFLEVRGFSSRTRKTVLVEG